MDTAEDRVANQKTESVDRSRMVKMTAFFFIVGPAGMMLRYIYLLSRYEPRQLLIPMGALTAVMGVSATSLILNHRGRATAAARMLVGGPLLVTPFVALALADAGIVLGVAAAFASIQIANLTLPREQMKLVILAAVIVGVSTILPELLSHGGQQIIPEDRVFFPIAAFILINVLGYLALLSGDFSIRLKLMTASVVTVILAVGATTYFANRTTSDILKENVSRELNSVAESQALAVGELLGRQTGLLQLLSQNQLLRAKAQASNAMYPLDPSRIRAQIRQFESQWTDTEDADGWIQGHLGNNAASELQSFQAAFPAYTETILTDRYGALQASTTRIPSYYQANEEWWEVAYNDGQGAVYIGPPMISESSGNLSLDIAVPLFDLEATEVIGVLRATYGVKDLTELLASSANLGQRISLALPSNAALAAGESSLTELPPDIVNLLQRESVRFSQDDTLNVIELDGEPSVVTEAMVNTLGHVPTVDSLGWRIIAYQNQADSLAVVEDQQRTLILIGAAVLAVTSAAVAIFARTLTRPITQLTDVARKVASGDLSARASIGAGGETGILASAFNSMTGRLQETLGDLERRVAERTRVLETSIEVSRSLSNILDHEQLLSEVVEQIQLAFGYYHAHVYLVDEVSGDLILAGGTGEAGKEMLNRGHRIPEGKGLVGRAAKTNNVVLASDTSNEEGWLPNPLLPDTRAEIATPIAIGGQVLGVIDVQHDEVGGLTEEDANLLASISSQVAIALRNVILFEQAQLKADREAKINAITLKIRDANNLEDVLQIAAQELGRTLQTQRASVQLHLGRQAVNGRESS